MLGLSPILVILIAGAVMSIKIVVEYDRLVIFVLGRFWKVAGPGPVIVIPLLMQSARVTLRKVVLDVPPQDVITRDNISIKVNAVIYLQVVDPAKAVVNVENYLYATSQFAQTTLRSVLGKSDMDTLLTDREKINGALQEILDTHTEPWGVKVSNVEVKNVDLAPEMLRAMARQAEAERERRAKVIHADGEMQASEKLSKAAEVLAVNPAAIQLRFLQTLGDIATEKNSTIIFPVPVDILSMFLNQKKN